MHGRQFSNPSEKIIHYNMQSQKTVSNTSSANFISDVNSESKYGGLLEQSAMKKLRNRMYILLTYVDGVVPEYYPLHAVLSAWRIIQLIGPAFAICITSIWDTSSVSFKLISYLSVIYHFCPVEYRRDCSVIIELVYSFLLIILFAVFFTAANEYRKTAKLPKPLLYVISIAHSTVLYVIHPVGAQFAGESISALIFAKDQLKFPVPLEIVGIVLTVIMFLLSLWYFISISSISFVFRPNSLMSVSSKPQILIFDLTCVIAFVMGIARYAPDTAAAGILTALALVYLVCLYSLYQPGTFISPNHRKFIFASAITGCVSLLMLISFMMLELDASEIQLFIVIGIFLISFLIAHFIFLGVDKRALIHLDAFMDDPSYFDEHVKTAPQFLRLVCVGMEYAHPSCIDWGIFRAGTEKFPDNPTAWIIYGKFVALYPEETNTLSFIIHSMISKKLKGNIAKQTIAQAIKIMTQRESTLNPELKNKMSKVSHQIQSSKRKLRHIWDLVIQGNINEMESSINNAYDSLKKSEADYNHLLSQYPNNRFVARAYSRFLKELKADEKGFNEWLEKIRQLERGIQVNIDKTTTLGMHYFPQLPKIIKNSAGVKQSRSMEELGNPSGDMDIDEDNVLPNNGQNMVVKERINNLRIPATHCSLIATWVFFIVVLFAPALALLVFAPFYVQDTIEPLNFMYHLSLLRSLQFQMSAFILHYVYEKYPTGAPFIAQFDTNGRYFALGGTNQTNKQVEYFVAQAAISNERLSDFRAYESGNEKLKATRDIVFSNTIKFDYYTNAKTSRERSISFQAAVMDMCVQVSKLANETSFPDSIVNDSRILNPIHNTYNLGDKASEALSGLIKFITSEAAQKQLIVQFIMICAAIVYVLIFLIATIVEITMISKNKKEIYRCLTALPKNIVSQMSESLRVLKKGGGDGSRSTECDSDISKQEENILKIFATAGDSSSSVSGGGNIILAICNICFIGMSIGNIVLLAGLYKKATTTMRRNSPHLDYILGASGFMIGTFVDFLNGVAAYNKPEKSFAGKKTYKELLNNSFQRLYNFQNYYNLARFGGSTTDEPPFSGFLPAIVEANKVVGVYVPGTVPHSIRDVIMLLKAEDQVFAFDALAGMVMRSILAVPDGSASYTFHADSELMNELWNAVAINMYDNFFYQMFDTITPSITALMMADLPKVETSVIIILVLMLLISIIYTAQLKIIDKKLIFTLNLLLFCPSQVVLQTPKIVDVLSGDLSDKIKDTTNRDDEFFDNVVMNMPVSVIIANQQYQIITYNTASERIYGVESSKLLNTSIHDFLALSSFEGDFSKIFEPNTPMPLQAAYKNGENLIHLELNCAQVSQNYIITTRDVTQTVSYNTLIEEEKSKSDALLAAILPANLVSRVQAGEKNISFAVQSATILFLDIVEFTPWCASNTAAMVMSTLNRLFRNLDSELSHHTTMTKIKCIGDCYMCAGGIFSEVNQPAVHAREVTEFGLEAIQCVRDIDEQLGLKLQIRVGINTGGPIVAGVLGTEKPTFEIIGPPINMAQQMEHHGIPMKVQISRSVYELVYGGVFTIKERGQVEVKNGSVVTYIVESKIGSSD